jgi:hypothetical protein
MWKKKRNMKAIPFFLAGAVLAHSSFVLAQETPPIVPTNPPAPPRSNEHPMSTDVTMFYDSLAPYGDWFWLDPYGWVWCPHGVAVDWRPYSDGDWAYTDCGWTLVSDAPWGWAPFHYGRWCFHEHRGWCWVPDHVWGPAWVSWHFGDAWCGWAPLPPAVAWESAPDWDVIIPTFGWCFVGREDFWRHHLRDHIVVAARNVTLLRETRNVTRFELRDAHVFNGSLTAQQIEHFTGRPARRLRVVDVNSVAGTRAGARGELPVFRPAPKVSAVITPPRPTPPLILRGTPPPATFDELRRRESERAGIEAAQQAQREALERSHQRELQQPPHGMSPAELQQRHEAEHRAFNEQQSRERQLFENRPPPPMRGGSGGRRNDR